MSSVIEEMFDQISPRYDCINRILSWGMDRRWRRQMATHVPLRKKLSLLDLATGTGEQLFLLYPLFRSHWSGLAGVDFSSSMLAKAKERWSQSPYAKEREVEWKRGDITKPLPFAEESFDCITLSFGLRNVSNRPSCMQEARRLLRFGGKFLILEFSLPSFPLFRSPALFYLKHILPSLGGWLSGERAAYQYLSCSIESFPTPKEISKELRENGFSRVIAHPLSLGMVTLYSGEKEE